MSKINSVGNSHSNSKTQDIQVPQFTKMGGFAPFCITITENWHQLYPKNLKEADLDILYQR